MPRKNNHRNKKRKRYPSPDLSHIYAQEEAYRLKTSGIPSLQEMANNISTPSMIHTLRIHPSRQKGNVKLVIAQKHKKTRNVLERILR